MEYNKHTQKYKIMNIGKPIKDSVSNPIHLNVRRLTSDMVWLSISDSIYDSISDSVYILVRETIANPINMINL